MWSLWVDHIISKGYVSPTNIISKVGNLSWGSDADTLSVSLTFDSVYDLAEGRTHVILKKDDYVVFQGVVVKKVNNETISSYTAMDYAFYLAKNTLVCQFNGATADTCIRNVCRRVGIKAVVCKLTTKIKKIYKDNTLSDIIKDILEQCKSEIGERYFMEMQGDILYVSKFTSHRLGCKLLLGKDYSVTRSMEDMVNRVLVVDNNEESARTLADVKNTEYIKIFGQMADIVQVEEKDVAQAKNIARNKLRELCHTSKELSIPTIAVTGGETVRANRMIEINLGKYGVNGWYRIKSASHSLDRGIHKIDIVINFS